MREWACFAFNQICIKHSMLVHKHRLRTSLRLATLALGLFLCAPLYGQEFTLELDPAQTHIQFTLSAVLHTVRGTFKLKRGKINFDARTGKAGGLVVVDVTSGESGNGMRDRKMHKEILQSQQFPEATFAPAQIKGSINSNADSQVEIQGIFNLHGADHPVTMTCHVQR